MKCLSLLCTVLSLWMLGCSETADRIPAQRDPSSEETLRQFYDAVKGGHVEKADRYILASREEWRRSELKDSLLMVWETMKKGDLVMDVVESRTRGDWAIVVSRATIKKNGGTVQMLRSEFMYNQKGVWKVVPEGIRSDPGIEPLIDENYTSLFRWYRDNIDELSEKFFESPEPAPDTGSDSK